MWFDPCEAVPGLEQVSRSGLVRLEGVESYTDHIDHSEDKAVVDLEVAKVVRTVDMVKH